MSQIPLQLRPRLLYAKEHFLLHAGVTQMWQQLLTYLSHPGFRLCMCESMPRSGKTHLSVALLAELEARGFRPRLVEAEVGVGLHELLSLQHVPEYDTVLIDRAELYFEYIEAQGSGDFVNAIEALRGLGSRLIFFCSNAALEFHLDEHVTTRLRAGMSCAIGDPAPQDMQALIQQLATQRGLALTPRKVGFLLKRLPREIKAIEEYIDRLLDLSHAMGRAVGFPLMGDTI